MYLITGVQADPFEMVIPGSKETAVGNGGRDSPASTTICPYRAFRESRENISSSTSLNHF